MKALFARFVYAAAFLAVVSYAFFTLRGPHGIAGVLSKEREIRAMELSNAGLAKEIERKKDHIGRLTDNPDAQELEIRERLQLVHPGEKVYITGEPAKK